MRYFIRHKINCYPGELKLATGLHPGSCQLLASTLWWQGSGQSTLHYWMDEKKASRSHCTGLLYSNGSLLVCTVRLRETRKNGMNHESGTNRVPRNCMSHECGMPRQNKPDELSPIAALVRRFDDMDMHPW